jgi:hypothetical protein
MSRQLGTFPTNVSILKTKSNERGSRMNPKTVNAKGKQDHPG